MKDIQKTYSMKEAEIQKKWYLVDADGKVLVIAKVEENEQYANVETEMNYSWGVPSMHGLSGSHRALWTPIAPMWMIVTLTVLLSGVWGHYIYVIIQLILIKRESKKLKF